MANRFIYSKTFPLTNFQHKKEEHDEFLYALKTVSENYELIDFLEHEDLKLVIRYPSFRNAKVKLSGIRFELEFECGYEWNAHELLTLFLDLKKMYATLKSVRK